ncbi:MAG: S8 family serine peptidase, partial [Acidimicrobiia bacterium]|nr:S8 family serine peptidase [Acidimicrobiia bacterium]
TDNSTDVASLGWNTAVMPIKVGSAAGVATSDEVAGLQYAVQHGVKIANLSIGSECYDATEANEVASAQASGVLIVAAAGNQAQNGDRASYPAALPGVLSVGATGRDGTVASYSNFGSYVDMVAPGGSADGNSADDLLLLSNSGGLMTAAGTSFSTPLVSAAAALLLAVNPAYTPDNLRSLLMDTATPLYGGRNAWTGVGLLDAARAVQVATLRSRFNPLTPARILDTRVGTGDAGGPFNTGETRAETIDGLGGVPSTGVSAVAMNVTVTQPSANGFVTIYPDGGTRPNASNLNFTAGETIPNLVVAPVGADGKVDVYNLVGSTHVIFDVVGWYGSTGDSFNPLTPARILDTRNGIGDSGGAFGTGETRAETIDGSGGVPASGVAAVVMNVTVTQPTVNGFLTLYPTGASRPNASNLNFTAGETIPNLVVVPVGPDGKVDVYNLVGSTHVIFDVVGWYPSGS